MDIIVEKQTTITKKMVIQANNLPQKRPRFMLDRDQIFYSSAFRRLAGKTQLVAAGLDDNLRTRLTHTLEVSQIARAIGEALGLDLDLVEAIVLGHDLGHTPFGHVGERTLHELMTPDPEHPLGEHCPLYGDAAAFPEELLSFLGFKHNLQSLVVVMEQEKSAGGRGLNLTKYTHYGLQAHTKPAYKKGKMRNHDMLGYYDKYLKKGCRVRGKDAWSLEALLVAQADEIAQLHHDLEDALRAGLVSPGEIVTVMSPMLCFCRDKLTQEEQELLRKPDSCDREMFISAYTRIVVQALMDALTDMAARKIQHLGGMIPVSVPAKLPGATSKLSHKVPTEDGNPDAEIFSYGDKNAVGSFAWAVDAFSKKIGSVLQDENIRKADEKGKQIILELFKGYYQEPEKLPEECMYAFFGSYHELKGESKLKKLCRAEFQEQSEAQLRQGAEKISEGFTRVFHNRAETTKIEELLLMRTICNHIASMTDADARRAADRLRDQ